MRSCRRCGAPVADRLLKCPACGAELNPVVSVGRKMSAILACAFFYSVFILLQSVCQLSAAALLRFLLDSRALSPEILYLLASNASCAAGIFCCIIIIALYAVYLFCFVKKKRPAAPRATFKKFKGSAAPVALISGIALNYAVTLLISVLPIPESVTDRYNELYSYLGNGSIALELLSVVVLAPVVEEVVFRGLCFGSLRKGFSPVPAAVLSAVLFGAAHGNTLSFVFTSVIGFILALSLERSGSILVPILIHVGFNGGSYLLELSPVVQTWQYVAVLLAASLLLTAVSLALLFGVLNDGRGKKIPAADGAPHYDASEYFPDAPYEKTETEESENGEDGSFYDAPRDE